MDVYYSMWRSRTVPSPDGSGRPSCETVLLHHEGFKIPENLARFAVRHGMTGFVKKMGPAVVAFVAERRARVGPVRALLMNSSESVPFCAVHLSAVRMLRSCSCKSRGKHAVPSTEVPGLRAREVCRLITWYQAPLVCYHEIVCGHCQQRAWNSCGHR